MLTIESFIAVISLCVACFSLGYSIGKDSKTKNNRPSLANLAVILTLQMRTNRLSTVPFYNVILPLACEYVNIMISGYM